MKDLPHPKLILDDFRIKLEAETKSNSWGTKYLNAFQLNFPFYEETINKRSYRSLPAVFKKMQELYFEKRKEGRISSRHKFLTTENLFPPHDERYLEVFQMKSKAFLDRLATIGTTKETIRPFFLRFLEATTFFCAGCGYKLALKEETMTIVPQEATEGPKDLSSEYYLFYCRSHIELHSIGIGSVAIVNDHRVDVEYYYSPQEDDPDKTKKYSTLKTTGRIFRSVAPSILVLQDVKDDSSWKENKYFRNFKPVYSHFIITSYQQPNEKILLGIHSSWNRDNGIPAATAIVLIEKTEYDKTYQGSHPFSMLKEIRGMDEIEKVDKIPPEIYYYLFHHTINLFPAINGNQNRRTHERRPFSIIEQLPFYTDESRNLHLVAGIYKGLTLVNRDGRDLLVISRLDIKANGMVFLSIANDGKQMTDPPKPDFIEYVTMDQHGQGKLYISLNYDYTRRLNSLNYFLEHQAVERRGEKVIRILKGGYAGESLVSGKLIGASIIFEGVEKDDFALEELPVLDEVTNEFNPKISDLYNRNKRLFNFYLKENSNNFSNHTGVEALQRGLIPHNFAAPTAINYKYDVFISIPLTHRRNEEEYIKNAMIAMAIRKGLVDKLHCGEDRIFCACAIRGNDQPMSFDDYGKKAVQNNLYHHNEFIQKKLDHSRHVFVIFPTDTFTSDRGQYRLSSSMIELGYCLGKGKSMVLICGRKEADCLPTNLTELYKTSIFQQDICDAEEVNAFFANEQHRETLELRLKDITRS